jgi:hypothetical protein
MLLEESPFSNSTTGAREEKDQAGFLTSVDLAFLGFPRPTSEGNFRLAAEAPAAPETPLPLVGVPEIPDFGDGPREEVLGAAKVASTLGTKRLHLTH